MSITWDDIADSIPDIELPEPSPLMTGSLTPMNIQELQMDDKLVLDSIRDINTGYAVNNSDAGFYALGVYGAPQGDYTIGRVIQYYPALGRCVALYKGFLLHDPQPLPSEVLPEYYSNYIRSQFQKMREVVKGRMPRRKSLKRLKLYMMTPQVLQMVLDNFDEIFMDDEESMKMKGGIATMPFYVDCGGRIMTYDMSQGGYGEITKQGANYLCWFQVKI